METVVKKRVVFLDYLRVISIFMVLQVHASEIFYLAVDKLAIKTPSDGFWVNLLDSPVRACVPLFVMASGYLLVPIKEDWGTFFKRRFSRVLIPFAIWSVIYAISPIFTGTPDHVGDNLLKLTYNFNVQYGHLWFVYMLIGVYLFLPIISPWLQQASKGQLQVFLGIWMISMLHQFVKGFLDMNGWFGEVFWNEFHSFYYFSGHLGYIVLAYYFRKYLDLSTSRRLIYGGLSFAIGYAMTFTIWKEIYQPDNSIYLQEIPWRFCTPNVLLMTVGLFFMISTLNKESKFIQKLSALSYGVYLSHLLLLPFVWTLLVEPMGVSTPVGIMLVTTFTFIFSNILTYLLSKLPKSKYLIG